MPLDEIDDMIKRIQEEGAGHDPEEDEDDWVMWWENEEEGE